LLNTNKTEKKIVEKVAQKVNPAHRVLTFDDGSKIKRKVR